MFCPQCGILAEASMKFCRACGLNLSEYARSFMSPLQEPERESREQAEQEIRQVRGVRTLAAAYFSSLFTLLLLGLAAAVLRGGDLEKIGPVLIILYMLLSVLLGGWGMYTLWRSKFFKTRKEHHITAYALLLEQRKTTGRLAPKPVMPPTVAETSNFHSPIVPISISEPTTRELQAITSDSGKIA